MNRLVRNTGIKAIAILLIITVIATLLPTRMVIWAEGDAMPLLSDSNTITGNRTEDQSPENIVKAETEPDFMLFPEINLEMDEKETIEERLDGYSDPYNFISYRKTNGEILGIVYPFDVKYLDRSGLLKDKSNTIVFSEESDFLYSSCIRSDLLWSTVLQITICLKASKKPD